MAAASSTSSPREKIRISVDLVAAARRHISSLYNTPTFPLPRSLRRYEHLWLPLLSDLSKSCSSQPMFLLPPADVLWIWHCHCLSPASYREYCLSRFGALLDRPAVFDEDGEECASDRCREVWIARYPSEPFDPEALDAEEGDLDRGGDLIDVVRRHGGLRSYLHDLFMLETVFLISARERYRSFLHLCRSRVRSDVRLVPTSDIALMWMTHKSFPGAYWGDMEAIKMEDLEERIVGYMDIVEEGEVDGTRRVWEEVYDEPYERAGMSLQPESPSRAFFYWEGSENDVNREYKAMKPRFLMEVHMFLKWKLNEGNRCRDDKRMFLCLRTMRCHRELKLELPLSSFSSLSWKKAWQIYCEFGTQGIALELRQRKSGCFSGSKLIATSVFQWNDLLRSTSLSLTKELCENLQAMVSITAPVQAPYLLKCVPDRVTDDSGAMVSDVILRMHGYRPQKGRWLSRTVLDQSRRECFVVRIRVAEGFWRRGAETPKAVKWEDRIIEVCQGPWSYVASSVGTSPQKVAGTARPKEEDKVYKKIAWTLSTGHLLTVQWEGHLSYQLENEETHELVRLERGRKLQYKPKKANFDMMASQQEEDQYATLIRLNPGNPEGKATALLNWRLSAVEFLPEEDAVLVLLLCTAILRSISELSGHDVGRLLLRRRAKETKAGIRDWGSVMLHSSLPHLNPWFWNADGVLSCPEVNDARQPTSWYSAADGKEEMYKQVIIP